MDASTTTKEHVVGRNFVPRGSLQGGWNLIANACRSCNGRKSQLEDDISAITMQPTVSGQFPSPESLLQDEARRKGAESISQRTHAPVDQSNESISITAPFMGIATATFGLICPPQIDEERAVQLARFHVGAFFYFITYNADTRRGGFWPGGFFPLRITPRGDWGNAVSGSFMAMAGAWPHRLLFTTQHGFFKVAIRRHPAAECWSWALEWNQNIRIIGLMGSESTANAVVATLTPDAMTSFRSGNEIFRFRPEVPLAEADDRLFQFSAKP